MSNSGSVATMEVKSTGKFTIPGLCMLKICKKPTTKTGRKGISAEVAVMKAKPESTVVKVFHIMKMHGPWASSLQISGIKKIGVTS